MLSRDRFIEEIRKTFKDEQAKPLDWCADFPSTNMNIQSMEHVLATSSIVADVLNGQPPVTSEQYTSNDTRGLIVKGNGVDSLKMVSKIFSVHAPAQTFIATESGAGIITDPNSEADQQLSL